MNIYTENEYDIIHELSIDFVNRSVSKEVHIVQYDDLFPIVKVELFSNGKRYILPEDANVKIRFGWFINDVKVNKDVLGCNQERNAIYFNIDSNMTQYHGKFIGVLDLEVSGRHGCSSPILFIIDRNPINNN